MIPRAATISNMCNFGSFCELFTQRFHASFWLPIALNLKCPETPAAKISFFQNREKKDIIEKPDWLIAPNYQTKNSIDGDKNKRCYGKKNTKCAHFIVFSMSSFTGARSKANANSEMTKANDTNLCPINTSTITSTSPDTSAKNEKKKKVFIYLLLLLIVNFFHALHFSRVVFYSFFFCLWSSLSFQRFSDQSEMGEVQTKRHSNHQVQKKEMELLLVLNSWHFFLST